MNWYKKRDYSNYPSQKALAEHKLRVKKCNLCKAELNKPRVQHINVGQDHPSHVFCNKKCRDRFIYLEQIRK